MVDISKVVTPGEFMLQAAAVRGDASAAIGRGMAIGAQQRENRERMDLLRQQMAAKQQAMNDFAQWQNNLNNLTDPAEKIRALGNIPTSVLMDEDARQAWSGMVNQITVENRIRQTAEEASGIAEQNLWRSKLRKYGVPNASLQAGPGDALYDQGARMAAEDEALFSASELGYEPGAVDIGGIPTFPDGRLNKDKWIGMIGGAAPLTQDKLLTADMRNFQRIQSLKTKVQSTAPGTPERTAAESELSDFMALAGPKGMEIETPEGTKIRTGIPTGGVGGATTATRSRVQGVVLSHRQLGEEMRVLQENLRDEDLGARGVLGELWDKWGPQFGLGSPDFARTRNRSQLKATIQGALRIASPDSRYTKEDLQRIEAMFPSVGFEENAERAKQNLATMREMIAKRTIWDLQAASPDGKVRWSDLSTSDEIKAAYLLGIGPDGEKRSLKNKAEADAFENEMRTRLGLPLKKAKEPPQFEPNP